MARVVFASSAATGGVVGEGSFQGLRHVWTGWDGSTWEMSNPDSGLFLTPDGIVGLGTGPGDRFFSASPGVAGSRYTGSRTLERPVVWPLHAYSDASTTAFVELDRGFWRTLRRDRTGLWSVQQAPTGELRTLECRFVGADDSVTLDPLLAGAADYVVRLVAEDPYWRGAPVRREFTAGSTSPFVPVEGGPSFTISDASTIANATIDNPGDVDAWPVWTVYGPTTDVTVGIGTALVGIPGDLDADDVLVIDTDPRRQSATLNGVRQRGILAPHDFAPIPAGGISALSLTMVGTGRVTVEITPRFERAW